MSPLTCSVTPNSWIIAADGSLNSYSPSINCNYSSVDKKLTITNGFPND